MASFKLNVATIKGCPPAKKVAEVMEKFGLPESEEYGVLSFSATSETVFGTIVRKTQQAMQKLDPENRQLVSAAVEKATIYAFGIKPGADRLEVYTGSAAAIEQVGTFLSSCLAFPTVVEEIELDVPSAIEKLSEQKNFQLKAIRISDYAHNSYMLGTYAPKFLDSQHGKDFMNEYLEFIQAASVRFSAPKGKANVSITPKACFGYSCHEEDQAHLQSVLRKLV